MKMQNSGLAASGQTRPEIRPGDKWQDRNGHGITVTAVAANRVTFLRDGYEYPCTCTPDRLRREFRPIYSSTGSLTTWRACKNPLEKTAMLKILIAASKNKTKG